MNTLLIYFIKVNAILTFLFLFYKIFIDRSTFHKWSRYFFLVSIFISAVIPLIDYSCWFPIKSTSFIPLMRLDNSIKVSGDTSLTYSDYVLILIGIGVIFLLIRFSIQLISLLHLYRKSAKLELNGRKIVSLNAESSPFSFYKWIFLNFNLHPEGDIDEIIQHEAIHVDQMHSFDILVYELVTILYWYNPLVWMMKQEMKQNLEYLVDRKMIKTGYNKQKYQYLLLRISGMNTHFEITSNFYFKQLKKRIMMMNKKESAYTSLLKYVLLIPVFVGMTLFLNAQNKLTGKNGKTEVVSEENAAPIATIGFDKDVHDFGTIKEQDGKVTAIFTFINNGKTPLVVNRVNASCGCTTPEWTKEPVAPGAKGFIKAIYDTKGRIYPFDKTITVYSNAEPSSIVLRIKGTVIK